LINYPCLILNNRINRLKTRRITFVIIIAVCCTITPYTSQRNIPIFKAIYIGREISLVLLVLIILKICGNAAKTTNPPAINPKVSTKVIFTF